MLLGAHSLAQSSAVKAAGKVLALSARGISTRGSETPDGFVVFSGSGASGRTADFYPPCVRQLRFTLISKKVLVAKGEDLAFTQDYLPRLPPRVEGMLDERP